MWKRRCFILYHTINVLETNYINNKVYAEQDAAAVKINWHGTNFHETWSQPATITYIF
jgi:hypothetical protein